MKKIVLLAAALVVIASAGVFAADPPPPPPLGITVGTEIGLGNLNGLKNPADPASISWGFTADYLHSIGMVDIEFFFQRDALLSPIAGQAGPAPVPFAAYPWFAAAIYFEGDAHFNIKLSDTMTLTPEISFQDNIFSSGPTTNPAPYGAFITNNALQDMFAIEPSISLTAGAIAIKVADNMTSAVDPSDNNVRPIHELYLQPTLTLGDFSVYVRGDFQPYITKMTWLKWGVSKGLPFAPGLSIYTYGSWNFFNVSAAPTYSAFNYYNQALGLSLAF